ncbi:MAG: Coenzyme F420-dependent N5,N10-methylene tetrahydromethanopterin reductase and related flavin-dependent oxidoreductases [uncultured Frankineae bacterium]|uniref:Coenzyme F420-dependent N5,N10-methylene tetrahydromethanopterin reductase and related flavin-dependent oxidoreductases n=1 Tax=uncultured Frankineae bacterium TaxID=437475 RepID=A0A6J4LEX3_9ACTN|nr:MAG: Coenzyme F420-dependent N5,N10-methylene tetrahydromethanopterin reductase and related flavin-dependent oxidoreductases [uncultured Frankineae bacterium]
MSLLPGPVGLWTAALDALEPAAARDQVADLDEQGWDALWFGEAYGREALTAAALYLGASRRLAVATGIASIYARDAVATNAAGRLLEALHPGRFVLGLGVSHAPLVERMRGHAYGRPLTAMRDYLDAMDAAPCLAAGSDAAAPRVLAALGPAMLALARDRAQGAHPYLVTPEHTAAAREVLGQGPLLAVEQSVVLSDDPDVVRERAHWHLEIYTGLPNYRNSWLRQGFCEQDFVRGGSDRLKQALVVGGEEAIVDRVRAHLDAGADHVCLQVLAADVATVPADDWARLAPVVASLR